MRVLFAEDDPNSRELVQAALAAQNLIVDVADSGLLAWEMTQIQTYDLLILDVMLPGLDGISLCQRLRQQQCPVPILLLTARDTVTDKLQGLEAGADDYVVKSADRRELMARVWALLRRQGSTPETVLQWGALRLNPQTRTVVYGDRPLPLSRKEYQIVELFLRYPRWVLSRQTIVDRIWSWDEDPPTEATVKSHIKAIRRKLKAVSAGELLKTVHGQGYCLNPAYGAVPPPTPEADKQHTLHTHLARLWERAHQTAQQRLEVIELLLAFAQAEIAGEPLLQQVEQLAHKLAGTLGTFGLEAASLEARALERLAQEMPLSLTQIPPMAQRVAAIRQALNTPSPWLDAAGPPLPAPAPRPSLLIVDGDGAAVEPIVAIARDQFEVTVIPQLGAARRALQARSPDLLLLDVNLRQGRDSGLGLLQRLATEAPQLPVVVFSHGPSPQTRLQALEWGVRAFLPRWMLPHQVLAVLESVQAGPPAALDKPYQVLAVDDDPQQLALLRTWLEPHDLQVIPLEQPERFWDTLLAEKPDLVLLDVQMPNISGLDLCRLIQSDAALAPIPVVIFTCHNDSRTRAAAFAAGADDVLAKTTPPEEILQRLRRQLLQTRQQQQQLELDPVTGLANRSRAMRQLQQTLAQAGRLQQPCWLAVIELDLTLAAGQEPAPAVPPAMPVEQQLGQFAYWLQRHCAEAEVLAHWQGAEFVVALLGRTRQAGVERLAGLLERWRTALGTPARFSAGVAQYPVDGPSLDLLYRSADVALHQAKWAGGDRVLPTTWQPLDSASPAYDLILVGPEIPSLRSALQFLVTRGYHAQWWSGPEAALEQLQGEQPPSLRGLVLAPTAADLTTPAILKTLLLSLPSNLPRLALLPDCQGVEAAQALGLVDYRVLPVDPEAIADWLRSWLSAAGPGQGP